MHEPGVVIREAMESDVEQAAGLLVRFYTFNEEFDPAWSAVESVEKAQEILRASLGDPSTIVLVAEFEGRIVGLARAFLVEEPMLANAPIGVLKELYVIPEMRRRGIATRLVEEMGEALRSKGAKALAAEFPARNMVAESFYEKLGFRPFKSVYIRETQG